MGENLVSYDEVLQSSNKNELIIDVREPKELEETGHIPGSINIPLGQLEDVIKNLSDEEFCTKFGRNKPKKEEPVTVHCKLGGRSAKAYALMKNLDYSSVKNYSGGWADWEKKSNHNE
ncbi:hypothetical protein GWI33_018157 [Rhynchophorus ferrugineus]|uniref:Rhodanese domain-containing protein n=1 Tax=Rhynchophorus ferrugineus TaxID=354439 RepID=A0A834I0W5_RHYFE|nr:hypothetical protein GWI33_018157 [Rhynchophorus ferrugineus]